MKDREIIVIRKKTTNTRLLPFIIACTLAVLAAPAHAKSPSDTADLVGARAAGAETEIQARGYENVKNNIWWNAATGTCVKVRVSNGRYARIDAVKASTCGQRKAASKASVPAAAAGSVGDVPQAALEACMKRADQLQNAKAGASMANGAARSGANWVLTMGTGTYSSKCTVTGAGKVVSIDPM
jgi:hypothetical protein